MLFGNLREKLLPKLLSVKLDLQESMQSLRPK